MTLEDTGTTTKDLNKLINKFYWYDIPFRTIRLKIIVYAIDSKFAFTYKLKIIPINLCANGLRIESLEPFWVNLESLEECINQAELAAQTQAILKTR